MTKIVVIYVVLELLLYFYNFSYGIERVLIKYYDTCRGKGPRSYNGSWVPYKSSTTSEEKVWVPKGLLAQFLWDRYYLKGGMKRNVSSDVPNMVQTCTLPAIRIHSYDY